MLANVNVGQCDSNIDESFLFYYQIWYVSLYVICLLAVVVLYIGVFVAVQRRRRLRQKRHRSQSTAVTMKSPTRLVVTPGTGLEQIALNQKGDENDDRKLSTAVQTSKSNLRRDVAETDQPSNVAGRATSGFVRVRGMTDDVQTSKSNQCSQSDSTFLANVRTAATLFVVTVVFIVTFLPALLMSLEWMTWSYFFFYLYFANNVANPVIYSFMNPNFRADLQRLVCKSKPLPARVYLSD